MSVKINWDEVPEEYEWFAIDDNGCSHYYRLKPILEHGRSNWVLSEDTDYNKRDNFKATTYSGTNILNWKETLQQRPNKTIGISATQEEKSFEMSLQRVGDMANLQISGKLSKEQIIKIMEVVYE